MVYVLDLILNHFWQDCGWEGKGISSPRIFLPFIHKSCKGYSSFVLSVVCVAHTRALSVVIQLLCLFPLQCEDREERDRLIMFIDKILYHKANTKLFLENNGMKLMVDMLTLAHLHTTRAYVPTQVRPIAVGLVDGPDDAIGANGFVVGWN